jgi:hypothetical protein
MEDLKLAKFTLNNNILTKIKYQVKELSKCVFKLEEFLIRRGPELLGRRDNTVGPHNLRARFEPSV